MLPLNPSVVARARALVGTPFRPQGRRPEDGLDCVGLVALAADVPEKLVPSRYTLRSQASEGEVSSCVGDRLERVALDGTGEGDIILAEAGAGQHHFLVLTSGGFIHADLRAGRVVERPGAVPWKMIVAWRARERR